MTKTNIVAGSLAIVAVCAGCQSTPHQRFSASPTNCEQAKVTVRFVNQPGLEFADTTQESKTQLVSEQPKPFGEQPKPCTWAGIFKCKTSQSNQTADNPSQNDASDITYQNGSSNVVKPCNMGGFAGPDSMPQHAVLWGGGHNGCNVTACPVCLDPGPYTFAYFDPDRGAAYQGWISINSGGDDVMSALTEWRDTVHRQEEWLAFEYKINGKYTSPDPADFKRFNGQLTNLRRLEGKINAAIVAEQDDRQQMCQFYNNYLGNTEVVLMPGPGSGFAQPATLPAFQPSDLSTAQGGQPVTKVILAGDFARSMEKVDRLNDLQDEMRRCRAVLGEEIVRLENRRSYYRLTSHLYDHDFNFMNNEKRVQQARGMLANIDRQITENRRHGHAVLSVVGLFAPEEANLAFAREQTEIRGERAVCAERLHQVEVQFSDASTWSEKRISLERQRQYLLGQLAECDTQLAQCQQASDTVAQLRQNTGVIYRNGPATILAASFINDSIPARLSNAIEKESMMTIRLHSAEGVRPSAKHLTEGEMIREQSFILTGDRPGANGSNPSNNNQPNLNDWSNTQRNFGQTGQYQNPSNCGHTNHGQP